MSTIEIILTRMMHEAVFADAVFADAECALMEYNLPTAEIFRFKTITRGQFAEMTVIERRDFATWVTHPNVRPHPLYAD